MNYKGLFCYCKMSVALVVLEETKEKKTKEQYWQKRSSWRKGAIISYIYNSTWTISFMFSSIFYCFNFLMFLFHVKLGFMCIKIDSNLMSSIMSTHVVYLNLFLKLFHWSFEVFRLTYKHKVNIFKLLKIPTA